MDAVLRSPAIGREPFSWRNRRFLEPRALPAYAVALVAALVPAGAVAVGAFAYDAAFLSGTSAAIGAVLLFAWAARWIGFDRVADPVEMAALLLLTGVLLALASAVFASTAAPMADELLRGVDRSFFGFDRRAMAARLWRWPAFIDATVLVYHSLSYTPILLMTLLVATGRRDRAWTLLSALAIAAAVSVASMLFFPAYGTPPYGYDFIEVHEGLRDGTLRTLDAGVVTGLVTFPSMHAADAVILALGSRWLGRAGWPLLLLNAAMFWSALIVGGHYLVDLIAGGLLGLGSLRVSTRLVGGIASPSSPRSAS